MVYRSLLILLLLLGKGLYAQTSLAIQDTRMIQSSPDSYPHSFQPHFKLYSTLGLPTSGTGYCTLLGFRGWGDDSGGKAHEIAFGNDNDIFVRSGYSAGWESWRRFIIEQNNGNVGIGINSPQAKLHIVGSLNGESSIRIGEPYAPGNIHVPVGAPTGGYNLDFYTWRDVQPDQIGARIRAERLNSYQPDNALVQSMDLVFYTSVGGIQTDLNEKLRIDCYGNVGIGISRPAERLAVNGKIRAKEVKVDASNWPDYVFSNSYKHLTLKDTETFVKANNRLPGMPSATEVEKEGIAIGEMNAKLLEKIEELTLYLIEQDKRIEFLETRLKNCGKSLSK